MIWGALLAAAGGCYAFKLAGMSMPEKVLAKPVVQRIAGLLPIVLLAALIAVQTVGSGRAVVIDARLAGLAVAGVAVWRRWPFLVVVALACVSTAVLRRFVPGS